MFITTPMSEDKRDWDQISENHLRSRWEGLSTREKSKIWKNVTHSERKAIINSLPEKEVKLIKKHTPYQVQTYKSVDEETKQNNLEERNKNEKVREAKYELTRIHREQVEEEISRIRESLEEAIQTSKNRSQRRRTENIYVLVAIGIVTGFFTIYPDFKISTQSVDLLAAAIAGASVLFLFIKLNTASIGELGQDTIGSKADRLADLLFQISISGAFLLAIGTIGVNAFNISLTSQSSDLFVFTLTVMLISLMVVQYKITSERSQINRVRFSDVQDAMFDLIDEDSQAQEENVDEFLELLKTYKEDSATTQGLSQIRERVSSIRGLSSDQIERIQDNLDNLIDEKSKETKTEQELREMRKEEREEKRREQREIIREYEFEEVED